MFAAVGTRDRGSPSDFDDSVIRDLVAQVAQVIHPRKEFAGRARAPGGGGSSGGGGGSSGGSAGGGGRQGGGADGGGAPAGGRATSTTNADGTPAPTSAGGVKKEIAAEPKHPKGEAAGKQDNSPDGKKKQKDDADKESSDWLSKVGGLGGLAMIGLTLGVATAIAAKTGQQYKACVDAEITITKFGPTPRIPAWVPDWADWEWLVKLFPVPKTIDITYTVNNDYKPLAKSDSWNITGTGGLALDNDAVPIEKVLEGKSVRIKCPRNNCSAVKGTGGTASVNCDFADRLNDAVGEVSTDIASTATKFVEGAGNAFVKFLPMIILIIVLYVLFTLFAK